MKNLTFVIAFLMAVVASSADAADRQPPRVVATIAPLHSLAAAVMEGVARPELLMQANASVHGFSLKPSQAKAIAGADLVLWVGPQLETFLTKPLSGKKNQLAMTRITGMALHEIREDGPWEGDAHDHGHGHKRAGEGDDLEIDGHLWLDVANAMRLADALAVRLSELDEGNAEKYRKNAQALKERLSALDGELGKILAGLKDRPFVVYHDAFQYFEKRYGLSGAGSLTLEERAPSAGKMAAIKKKIAELKAVCVLREPQMPARLAELAAEGSKARLGVLDDLGSGIEPGPGLYETMMRKAASDLSSCLAEKP